MSKLFTVAMGGILLGGIASAQNSFYFSTIGANTGSFVNGGAVAGAAPVTKYVSDDIHIDPIFAGMPIRTFTFNVVNTSAINVTARPRMRFHNANGTVTGPTGVKDPASYIAGYTFTAISFTPGNNYYTTGLLALNAPFVVSADGNAWYGWTFDNNANVTGATDADLNTLGIGKADAYPGFTGFLDSTNAYYLTNGPHTGLANFVTADGAQSTFAGSDTLEMEMMGISQDYNFNLTLQGVTAPAYDRTLQITLTSGSVMIASYYIITFASASATPGVAAMAIRCPQRLPVGATNPITITIDGGPYLKNKIDVTLPDAPNDAPIAITIPDELMINGDVDQDGEVGLNDIDMVITDYGQGVSSENDAIANSDVDQDGEVGLNDIDTVISSYGLGDE